MHKIKFALLTFPVAILVLSIGMPVYAQSENSGRMETANASSNSEDSASNTHTESDQAKQTIKLRQKGIELLAQAKKEHRATKSKALRIKACTSRKNDMQKRITTIDSAANKHLKRADTIYAQSQSYKTSKNLTVNNWESLVSSADSAKTAATTSVTTLTSLAPTVDCTSDTLATDLTTYQAAVAQAHTDLKTYRSSIKVVITALQAARGAQQ